MSESIHTNDLAADFEAVREMSAKLGSLYSGTWEFFEGVLDNLDTCHERLVLAKAQAVANSTSAQETASISHETISQELIALREVSNELAAIKEISPNIAAMKDVSTELSALKNVTHEMADLKTNLQETINRERRKTLERKESLDTDRTQWAADLRSLQTQSNDLMEAVARQNEHRQSREEQLDQKMERITAQLEELATVAAAPSKTEDVKPPEHPPANDELDSVMAQFAILQQDVARRRAT